MLPAAICYHVKKTKKTALLGLALGTVIMTIFGDLFNAVYLLPKFSVLFGLPLDQIVSMGSHQRSHSLCIHSGAFLRGSSSICSRRLWSLAHPAAIQAGGKAVV